MSEVKVEREQLRHRHLDALAEFIDQAERATSNYDRNLARNNLQDAIADYKRFYGGDQAAMADLQSYADRLGVLWQGSPAPGGGPSELAVPTIVFGAPYTGADPTLQRSGSKGDYARYTANPPATDAATAALRAGGVAGQPSAAQYLSRSYQAALPYMAGQTFGGQPAGPISLFGPQRAGTSMPGNPFAAVPPAYPATASPYSMRAPQLDTAMPLGQPATVTGIGILAKEMVKPQRGPLDVDDDDVVRAADAPLSSGGRDKGTATPADDERAATSGAADSGSGTDSSIITKPSSQLNTLPPEGLTTEEWMRQRNELLAKKKAVAEAEAAAAAKSTRSTAVKK